MTATDNPVAAIRFSAMNALARREHSRAELERKLADAFADHRELVGEVLDGLAAQGLQSDLRFVESFCRYRIGRGHGPIRIRSELRAKGVSGELVAQVLGGLELDWFDLARETCLRRFGEGAAADQRERAKRFRFLQYRGFTQEQISYAMTAGEG